MDPVHAKAVTHIILSEKRTHTKHTFCLQTSLTYWVLPFCLLAASRVLPGSSWVNPGHFPGVHWLGFHAGVIKSICLLELSGMDLNVQFYVAVVDMQCDLEQLAESMEETNVWPILKDSF